jgi:hypothetical protein
MIFAFVAACGSKLPPSPDASVWTPLVTQSWSLDPGTEAHPRGNVTITNAITVHAIRQIAPPGTHHTLLGFVPPAGTDPTTDPGGLVFASGVGTGEFDMPPGVGITFQAGAQLSMQLHVVNTTDGVLTGESGIEVVASDPDPDVQEAEIILPGPSNFTVAPGVQTLSGTCTLQSPTTIIGSFPHMHTLGTYLTQTAATAGTTVTIADGPFSFNEQRMNAVPPLSLAAGDVITTTCTWDNTTGNPVASGASTFLEMCFGIVYRYPRLGQNAYCDDAVGP